MANELLGGWGGVTVNERLREQIENKMIEYRSKT